MSKLYKEILEFEKQNAPNTVYNRSSCPPNLASHLKFLNTSKLFILLDFQRAEKLKIPTKMWTVGLYNLFNTQLKDNLSIDVSKFLDDAFNIFADLTKNLKLQFFNSKNERVKNIQKKSIPIWHKSVCCLADIQRYKALYTTKEVSNWELSKQYYREAIILTPNNGFYYSQLGQVSAKTDKFVDSLNFYLRCFCVRSPYLNSKESIGLLFQYVRDSRVLNRKSNLTILESQFISLIEILYLRINIDDFPKHYSKFLSTLTRAYSSTDTKTILNFTSICVSIFSIIQSTKLDDTKETDYLTPGNNNIVGELVLDHLTTLCGGILGVCLDHLVKLMNQDFDDGKVDVERGEFGGSFLVVWMILNCFSAGLKDDDSFVCIGLKRNLKTKKFMSVWASLTIFSSRLVSTFEDKIWIIGFHASNNYLPERLALLTIDWEYAGFQLLKDFINKDYQTHFLHIDESEMEQLVLAVVKAGDGYLGDGFVDRLVASILVFSRFEIDFNFKNGEFSYTHIIEEQTIDIDELSDTESLGSSINTSNSDLSSQSETEGIEEFDERFHKLILQKKRLRSQIKDHKTSIKSSSTLPSLNSTLAQKGTIIIFDTNCFLRRLPAIKTAFQNKAYIFHIPIVVLMELEGLKKNLEKSQNANSAVKFIEDLFTTKTKPSNVKLQTLNGNFLKSLAFARNEAWGDVKNADDVILKCCQVSMDKGGGVVLFTDDVNLRVKALAGGVLCSDKIEKLWFGRSAAGGDLEVS